MLEAMNKVQIEENPDAYVTNIEKNHRRQEEIRRQEIFLREECAKRALD